MVGQIASQPKPWLRPRPSCECGPRRPSNLIYISPNLWVAAGRPVALHSVRAKPVRLRIFQQADSFSPPADTHRIASQHPVQGDSGPIFHSPVDVPPIYGLAPHDTALPRTRKTLPAVQPVFPAPFRLRGRNPRPKSTLDHTCATCNIVGFNAGEKRWIRAALHSILFSPLDHRSGLCPAYLLSLHHYSPLWRSSSHALTGTLAHRVTTGRSLHQRLSS